MSARDVASDHPAEISVHTAKSVRAPVASASGALAEANGRSAVVTQMSRTRPVPMAAYPTVPGKKPPALNASQTTSATTPAGARKGATRARTPVRTGGSAGGDGAGGARRGAPGARTPGRRGGSGGGGGAGGWARAVVTGAVTRHLSAGVGVE